MRLIDADELRKCAIPCETHNSALTELCVPLYQIDNAPTVEPQKVVTIPHELIEKLVLCVVDTVENIDWDKAIEAYKERPQGDLADEVWKLYEKYHFHLATHVIEFGYELKELLGKYQKGGAE